jgi:hypothetical protein
VIAYQAVLKFKEIFFAHKTTNFLIINQERKMPNLKRLVLLALPGLLAGLSSIPAQAHLDKNTDLNGGHYDYFGNYHCHQSNCRVAPSRNDLMARPRLSNSNRDQELFYLEDDWPHWMLISDCQNVRTQILEATSSVPLTWTNPRHCEIREGSWTDPYTGEEFARAARLEIDHIIPPAYANAANGYQWSDEKRMQFANDPLNLIPVSRDSHRKKRDRGIGNWRPDEDSFHCEYAAAWRDVSTKYDLDLFQRDRSRMNTILKDCDIPERDFEQGKKTDVEVRANGIPVPL